MKTTQITEYWINLMDRWGDTQRVEYLDSRKEAKGWIRDNQDVIAQFHNYDVEKVVRKYRGDGELMDEQFTLIYL